MAKSISVAVGESETIAVGRRLIVTAPFAAFTVTGNAVADALVFPGAGAEPELEQAVTKPSTTATTPVATAPRPQRSSMSSSIGSRRTKCARCDTVAASNEPPFLRGQVSSAQ